MAIHIFNPTESTAAVKLAFLDENDDIIGFINVDSLPISEATEEALGLKANDDEVLHKTGNADELVKGDDTSIDIIIAKEFDETTSIYTTTSGLIAQGYTTENGYVQGSEIVCRNDSSNGYRRYEKMSDDDDDWMVYSNASGWQNLPTT